MIAAPTALADGDPASDLLASTTLFNPSNSGVSLGAQARLEAVLTASRRAGFPIRVALIASGSAGDLGTVTSLWRQPRRYAYYLWYELKDVYAGQVLVVMPGGFGLWGPRSGPHAVMAPEQSVRATAPGPGEQLAAAAISAVPLLARAAGHPIPAAKLAAAERVRTPPEASRAGSGGLSAGALVALAVGALLIALSWTLSLRARPLRPHRGSLS